MFKIISEDGKILEIPDGIYDVTAKITVKEGKLISINDGTWRLEQGN